MNDLIFDGTATPRQYSLLKESPRRITRLNLNLGKEQGGALKYKVFYRYVDRVMSLTYDVARRLADDTEELEQEIFPALLSHSAAGIASGYGTANGDAE